MTNDDTTGGGSLRLFGHPLWSLRGYMDWRRGRTQARQCTALVTPLPFIQYIVPNVAHSSHRQYQLGSASRSILNDLFDTLSKALADLDAVQEEPTTVSSRAYFAAIAPAFREVQRPDRAFRLFTDFLNRATLN